MAKYIVNQTIEIIEVAANNTKKTIFKYERKGLKTDSPTLAVKKDGLVDIALAPTNVTGKEAKL